MEALTILLIDDQPQVLRVMAEMLASDGHRMIEAGSGREALARLEAGERVDLVLTDLGMPGMTGWEVAGAIRRRWPHLPVGILTGWGEELPASQEERDTVDFLIAKPFTLRTIREAIARIRPDPPAA